MLNELTINRESYVLRPEKCTRRRNACLNAESCIRHTHWCILVILIYDYSRERTRIEMHA